MKFIIISHLKFDIFGGRMSHFGTIFIEIALICFYMGVHKGPKKLGIAIVWVILKIEIDH
jgi:hypothetical protein